MSFSSFFIQLAGEKGVVDLLKLYFAMCLCLSAYSILWSSFASQGY